MIPKKKSSISSANNSEYSPEKNKYRSRNVDEEVDVSKSMDESSMDDVPEETVCLFRTQHLLFTFRGKHVPIGQYEFPFTFTLPEVLPSSF